MCHKLLSDPRLFKFIQQIDADAVAALRGARCCHCGGRLDRADYPRKPRGLPAEVSVDRRASFCCSTDGCRRRRTPPQLLFLPGRVYVSVAVVLVAAMRQGPSPERLARLRDVVGVDRRTVGRWLSWWRDIFPQTPTGRLVQAAIIPPVDPTTLPSSLLTRLRALAVCPFEAVAALLRLVTPGDALTG